jgi:hypothetical protein
MSSDDVAGSVQQAKDDLREDWRWNGATDATACPSCGATGYGWEIEETQVRMRCQHCGCFDMRRHRGG